MKRERERELLLFFIMGKDGNIEVFGGTEERVGGVGKKGPISRY